MTNVARHSGARALSVIVTDRAGGVRTIIEDDGSGFDPETERRNGQSVGIHGMIERIDLLGGRLEIESSDTGTFIYAEVPAPTMRTGT
jgi:signal transduction histidine kinase